LGAYSGGGFGNNFYDTDTSQFGGSVTRGGLATGGLGSGGTGSGDLAGLKGMNTANMMTLANFNSATVANGNVNPGWSITGTSSTTPNNTTWFMAPTFITSGGVATYGTRPILISELFNNNLPVTIQNAHQLQLMDANLAGTYSLGASIDMTASMTNAADVWGTNYNINPTPTTTAGFVPIGTGFNGNGNNTFFTGNFDGKNYRVNNLYIYQNSATITTDSAGLFGNVSLGASGYIRNLNLSVNISAGPVTGGLIGNMPGGSGLVSNIGVSGKVAGHTAGYNATGGLIGVIFGGSTNIINTYSGAAVTSDGTQGGLIGFMNTASTVKNSLSFGSVNNGVANTNVAGFIGLGGGFTVVNSCERSGSLVPELL